MGAPGNFVSTDAGTPAVFAEATATTRTMSIPSISALLLRIITALTAALQNQLNLTKSLMSRVTSLEATLPNGSCQ
jgi:hypothetical protein